MIKFVALIFLTFSSIAFAQAPKNADIACKSICSGGFQRQYNEVAELSFLPNEAFLNGHHMVKISNAVSPWYASGNLTIRKISVVVYRDKALKDKEIAELRAARIKRVLNEINIPSDNISIEIKLASDENKPDTATVTANGFIYIAEKN